MSDIIKFNEISEEISELVEECEELECRAYELGVKRDLIVSKIVAELRTSFPSQLTEYALECFEDEYADDEELEMIVGDYECDKSPVDICVYDTKSDPRLEHCIFCGQPDERK